MAKAVALYTGGIHSLVEVAVREDGRVFQRYQSKGRYGYTWSRWAGRETVDVATLPATRPSGFATLFLANPVYSGRFKDGKLNLRLPG